MSFNPGISNVATYEDRIIEAFSGHCGPCIGVLLAAGQGDLLKGQVLGKNSTTQKYEALRRSTLSADEAIGQTVLSVTDPSIFLVGKTASIMEADGSEVEDLGAITAKDATTITVTSALAAAKSAGAYIYVNNGSQAAKVILAEGVPNQVTDVSVPVYLGGTFYAAMLLGMDALAKTALGARQIEDYVVVPA